MEGILPPITTTSDRLFHLEWKIYVFFPSNTLRSLVYPIFKSTNCSAWTQLGYLLSFIRHWQNCYAHIKKTSTHWDKNLKGKKRKAQTCSNRLFAQNMANKSCKAGHSPASSLHFGSNGHMCAGRKPTYCRLPKTSIPKRMCWVYWVFKGKINTPEGQTAMPQEGRLRRQANHAFYLTVQVLSLMYF